MIELSCRLLHLLTQKIKRGDFFSAGVVNVNMNVVADRVGGPKSINAARNQEILCCNVLEEFLRIIEKFARLFSDLWVVENRRVTPAQLTRMEKRRPINVFDQLAHRNRYFSRTINAHSQKFGFRRH